MTIYDLSERSAIILKKYEKYDAEAKKQKAGNSGDPFTEELEELDAEIEKLLSVAAEVALDSNRAAVAAKNAEIRRVKNVLLNEAIPSVEKMAKKGKRLNKEILKDREMRINALIEKIYSVPDGMSLAANKRPTRYNRLDKHGKSKAGPVLLDMDNAVGDHLNSNPLYWQENEDTQVFEKGARDRMNKQDNQLDRIGIQVDRLGEVATNMGEALDRQDPVLDDIEQQINKATSNLKTNNVKLKGLIHKMSNARNFCVDVVLIIVCLSIGAYLYTMFKK